MTEFLVLWVVSLAGLALVGDPRHRLATALSAPIVGTAAYLVAGSFLVAFEAFSVGWALAIVGAAGAAALGRRAVAGRVDWTDLARSALVTTAVVAAAVVATQSIHVTRLSPDSGRYLIIAGMLGETGSVAAVEASDLLKRLLGTPLLHVIGFDGPGYSASWAPLLGLSAVGTVLAVAWARLRPAASSSTALAGLLAAPLVLVLTADRFVWNLTYVNGHLLFGALLAVGVARLWEAAQTGDHHGLLAAGLAFGALLTVRAEAAIVVAIFLLPLVLSAAWDLRARLVIVAPSVAVAVAWYGLTVRPAVDPDALGITGPVDSVFVIVGGIVTAAVVATWLPARLLRRVAIGAMAVALVAYLLWNLAVLPEEMAATLTATATNLTTAGLWGLTWPILAVLVAAVFVSRAVPDDSVFAAGLPLYALALVAFSFLREGAYRVGPGDSGNRMIAHVLLVALLYVLLGVGRAVERRDEVPATRSEEPA